MLPAFYGAAGVINNLEREETAGVQLLGVRHRAIERRSNSKSFHRGEKRAFLLTLGGLVTRFDHIER